MFFLYTLAGSMLTFAGVLYFGWKSSTYFHVFTLELDKLYQLAALGVLSTTSNGGSSSLSSPGSHQGPALPAAYLAALAQHRGPDGRLRDPRRPCWLKSAPTASSGSACDAPAGDDRLGPVRRLARRRRHHLRRIAAWGAKRRQEARRLLVRIPPRLLPARHVQPENGGPSPVRCST